MHARTYRPGRFSWAFLFLVPFKEREPPSVNWKSFTHYFAHKLIFWSTRRRRRRNACLDDAIEDKCIYYICATSILSLTNAQDSSSFNALCASQNEALKANAALVAATPYLLCSIDYPNDSCTVDFEPISDNYKDACYDAGGKFYVVDLLWDCSSYYGISLDQYFNFLNFPFCFGLNCTADELENLSYETYEQDILAEQGYKCNLSDKNEMIVEKSGDQNTRIAEKSGAGTLFNFSISGILGFFAVVMVVMHPY